MLYGALSRVKRVNQLHLTTKPTARMVNVSPAVLKFYKQALQDN
ncbi:hypothetical protein [Lactobacillus crispatus]|nr:hypothetical protein [Lactobacillus crispatus]